MEFKIEWDFIKYVLNMTFPLQFLFAKAGLEYPENGGSVFCPFHEDFVGGKRSGSIYHDPDGDRLHCYAEGRQYNSTDFIRLVLQKDPTVVFNDLWENKFTDQKRAELKASYGQVTVGIGLPDDVKNILSGFRDGKMGISEFKECLLEGVVSLRD